MCLLYRGTLQKLEACVKKRIPKVCLDESREFLDYVKGMNEAIDDMAKRNCGSDRHTQTCSEYS